MMNLVDAQNAYDNVNAKFSVVSKAYTVATAAYRSRTMGDVEFLNARAALDAVRTEFDAAFAELESAHDGAVQTGAAFVVDGSQINLF